MPTVPYSTPRVRQAPLADTSSTSRATAADFGSQTAAAIGGLGQAVGRVGELAEAKQKEDAQREAMEAGNLYQAERGKIDIDFRALNPADITDEVLAKRNEDIKNVQTRLSSGLKSARAQQMFKQFSDHDIVVGENDAYAHFVKSGKVVTERVRKDQIEVNFNEARAGAGTDKGRLASMRAYSAINADPDLKGDEAAKKLRIQDFDSKVLAGAVEDRLATGDIEGAQKIYDQYKPGALNPGTKAAIEGELTRVTEFRTMDSNVRNWFGYAQSANPPVNVEGLEANLQFVKQSIERNMVFTPEQKVKYNKLAEGIAQDQFQALKSKQDSQLVESEAVMAGAQDATARRAQLERIRSNPATAWQAPRLEGMLARLESHEGQEDAQADKARKARLAGVISDNIHKKFYSDTQTGEAAMVSDADAFGLSVDIIRKLKEERNGNGIRNHISRDKLSANLPEAMKAKFTGKNADQLFALQDAITEEWSQDRPPTDAEYRKLISNWTVGGWIAKSQAGTRLEARSKGNDALRAWRVALTPAELAAAGAEMDAEYKRTGNEAFNRNKPLGLIDTPASPATGFSDRNAYDPFWEQRQSGVKQVQETSDDAVINQVMRRHMGIRPGAVPAEEREAEQDMFGFTRAYQRQTFANQTAANFEVNRFISQAVHPKSGEIGVEGARRLAVDAMEKGEVLPELQQYSTRAHGESLLREDNKTLSDEQWKKKVIDTLFDAAQE